MMSAWGWRGRKIVETTGEVQNTRLEKEMVVSWRDCKKIDEREPSFIPKLK